MNRKVLKTMLALVVIFLVGLYILKIFIPEQFVLSIENEQLVAIGNYIDTHEWAYYTFGIVTSFITYWLYLCAVCRKWYLNWKECIVVLLTIGLTIGANLLDTNLYTALSYSSFVFLPLLFKAHLREVGIVYTVHLFSQALSLSIRSLETIFVDSSTLTVTIMTLECYFWLLLFYFYYNYKKEVSSWDGDVHQCMVKNQSDMQNVLQESKQKSNLLTKIKQSTKKKSQKSNQQKLRRFKLWLIEFITCDLWVYIVVIGSIMLCAWVFNRWIEGIMFCVAHICIRRVFDKQFHFNSTAYCITLTMAIVWCAIPITMSTTTSLLSSIPIAFIVCFFGFVAQDWVDSKSEKRKRTKVTLNNLTEEQFTEICNELGYKKDKIDIAHMFFIEKLSNKQVWEILCKSQRNVEWDTVNKYKYRISKDFKRIIGQKED